MTQSATYRSHFRTLPGHIYTPEGPGRETESITIPCTPQQITFTLAGADPITAGDYDYNFVTPSGNFTVTVTQAAVTPTAASVIVAAALNADPNASAIFNWTSALGVVTGVALSGNLSIAVPTTSTVAPTTNTAAISVANAANSLRMGVFYTYGASVYTSGAVTNTPRGARTAALPTTATTAATLRGVVARPVNQTELSPTFIDSTTPDAYVAGQVGFGALRGEVCVVVDPASGTLDAFADAVYVVLATGTYSIVGSVADAADGGNTLRLDNTTPVRARVTGVEETFTMGAFSGRCVVLKVNQTN